MVPSELTRRVGYGGVIIFRLLEMGTLWCP